MDEIKAVKEIKEEIEKLENDDQRYCNLAIEDELLVLYNILAYAKRIKALEAENKELKEKVDIWKDPKVELPDNDKTVCVVIENNKLIKTVYETNDDKFSPDYREKVFTDYNDKRKYANDWYWYSYKIDKVKKWAYTEDLIKQSEV